MPARPPRPCPTPGCCNLSKAGPCSLCRRHRERLRGTAAARGYNDRQHRAWREDVIQQSMGLCVACMAQGRVEAGRVADHVVPRSAGGPQYDTANGQALCDQCHNIKRAAESRGRQMFVVDGHGLQDAGPLRATGGGPKSSDIRPVDRAGDIFPCPQNRTAGAAERFRG